MAGGGVDIKAVSKAVAGLTLVGNEEGLIPAFGLYLTRHYATFYNRVSYAYLHETEKASADAAKKARAALVEAGHVCAFNTFGGIMLSQEWDAVVAPMITNREDWVHGIVGVINALGWGVWSIDELSASKTLKISVANSYESNGYVKDYGTRKDSSEGVCFLVTGGVAGIMNLLYFGDITSRPALNEEYYKRIFSGAGRFIAREVACRANGAPKCEFVCERQQT